MTDYTRRMRSVALIGVPFNSSGTRDGVALASNALREAGIMEALGHRCDVADLGDLELPEPSPVRDAATAIIDPQGLAALTGAAHAAIGEALQAERFPLLVGGDCPVLLGCMVAAASRAGELGLLFVDGHEDAYQPFASPTGEAADMELGFLLGLSESPAAVPLIPAGHVAVLGARDGRQLREEGRPSIRTRLHFRDDAELATDPEAITQAALSAIPPGFWFHVDLDVLSTEALPSVDYPQDGGIGWIDLTSVARTALAASPIGWDVTIYNPELDADGRDARRIVRFLAEAIGLLPAE